jgi:hypothetical protein
MGHRKREDTGIAGKSRGMGRRNREAFDGKG